MAISDIEYGPGLNRDDSDSVCTESTTFSSTLRTKRKRSQCLVFGVLLVLGVGIPCTFFGLGIKEEKESQIHMSGHNSEETAALVKFAWLQYEAFSLWAHESCHHLPSSVEGSTDLDDVLHMCSRDEFRNIYEHIVSTGVKVSGLNFAPRVEQQYRSALELESMEWLEETHPEMYYEGITVTNWTAYGPDRSHVPEKPVYYPLHRVEPWERNQINYDRDTYFGRETLVDSILSTWKPSLSAPFRPVQGSSEALSVCLTHPGAKTSVLKEGPHSLLEMVIRIQDLLKTIIPHMHMEQDVYLYDSTDGGMLFLGAAHMRTNGEMKSLGETDYRRIGVSRKRFRYETAVRVVDREWTVVTVPNESFAPPLLLIIGGIFIFITFVALAVVLKEYLARIDSISRIKSRAEMEKAHVYQQQVQRERRMNEYLSHEVRKYVYNHKTIEMIDPFRVFVPH